MLAGIEYPPSEWMNEQLRALGEKWNFSLPVKQAAPAPTIIQQVLSQAKLATLEFEFYSDEFNARKHEVTVVSEDGLTAQVDVTVRAVGEVTAKNGAIWLRVCDACNWAKEPEGFVLDKSKPKDREKHFDVLYHSRPN